MGGKGSGRRRSGSEEDRCQRKTIDPRLALKVRDLKDSGLIDSPGQERVGVLVRFRRRKEQRGGEPLPGGGWEEGEIPARLRLEWTACNFGGSRPWFLCPGCDRRAAHLYPEGGRLLCRTCLGLSYPSQSAAARKG